MSKRIWENIFRTKNWGRYPAEELVRFVARNYQNIKTRPKIKILEIGCGVGGNLVFLAKENFTIFGIDFSKTAILKSRKNLNKEAPKWKGKLINSNVMNHQFDKEQFDLIIDNEMSCCLSFPEVLKLYKMLNSSLKNGGKIFLRTFSKNSYGDRTGKEIGYNFFIPSKGIANMGPQRFSTSRDINKIFKENYKITYKEIVSRSLHNRKNKFSEWVVVAVKNV